MKSVQNAAKNNLTKRNEKLILSLAWLVDKRFKEGDEIWLAGESLLKLLDAGIEVRQGEDPIDSETLAFFRKHPQVLVAGLIWAVHNGFYYFDTVVMNAKMQDGTPTLADVLEFANLFHRADDFQVTETSGYAWFD